VRLNDRSQLEVTPDEYLSLKARLDEGEYQPPWMPLSTPPREKVRATLPELDEEDVERMVGLLSVSNMLPVEVVVVSDIPVR
jgi:hypothetical protein